MAKFVKGQSGNPRGRKTKIETIAGHLEAAGLTDSAIAEKLMAGFSVGDPVLSKMAVEYKWGKPLQKTENYNEHVFPTQIEVVLKNAKKDSQA